MTQVAAEISGQVEHLERLRAEGRLDPAWYYRARTLIVRDHRARRRPDGSSAARWARATVEIPRTG